MDLKPETAPHDGSSQTVDNGGGAPAAHATSNVLTPIIERLVTTLETETHALSSEADLSRGDFINEKSKLMLALIQIQDALDPSTLPPSAINDLRRLKTSLAANALHLGQHIEAVGDIARTLERIVDANASDGTYSRYDF